ncbi:uncharacterized protein J3D65DRAFT_672332 [Phyllosticta citribraziliensis]|uniref:Uncharacterized protein n=1 Tax=Phyllosticta citribraziliensis TaxID=989973 RepID=A0ABR1L3Y1_9PEZI
MHSRVAIIVFSLFWEALSAPAPTSGSVSPSWDPFVDPYSHEHSKPCTAGPGAVDFAWYTRYEKRDVATAALKSPEILVTSAPNMETSQHAFPRDENESLVTPTATHGLLLETRDTQWRPTTGYKVFGTIKPYTTVMGTYECTFLPTPRNEWEERTKKQKCDQERKAFKKWQQWHEEQLEDQTGHEELFRRLERKLGLLEGALSSMGNSNRHAQQSNWANTAAQLIKDAQWMSAENWMDHYEKYFIWLNRNQEVVNEQRRNATLGAERKVGAESRGSLVKREGATPETSALSERSLQFIAEQKKLHKQFKDGQKLEKQQFHREEKQRKKEYEKWTLRKYYNELEARMGVLLNNSLTTAGGVDMSGKKRIPKRKFSAFLYAFKDAKTGEERDAWAKKWAETIKILNQAQHVEDAAEKNAKRDVGSGGLVKKPDGVNRLVRRGEHPIGLCVYIPDERPGLEGTRQFLCGELKKGRMRLRPVSGPKDKIPLTQICVDAVDRKGMPWKTRLCGMYRKNGELEMWPEAGRMEQEASRWKLFYGEQKEERKQYERDEKERKKKFEREEKERKAKFGRNQREEWRQFNHWDARIWFNDIEAYLGLRNNSLTTLGGFNEKGEKRLWGEERNAFLHEGLLSGPISREKWEKKWAKTIELLNSAQDRVDNALRAEKESQQQQKPEDPQRPARLERRGAPNGDNGDTCTDVPYELPGGGNGTQRLCFKLENGKMVPIPQGIKKGSFLSEGLSGFMSRKKWAKTIAMLNDAQDRVDEEQRRQTNGSQQQREPEAQQGSASLVRRLARRLTRRDTPTGDACADVPYPDGRNGTQRLCGKYKDNKLELSPKVKGKHDIPVADVCADIVDKRNPTKKKRMCGKYKNGKLNLWPKADRDTEAIENGHEFDAKQDEERRQFDLEQARRRKDFYADIDRRWLNGVEEKLGLRKNSLTTGGGRDSKGKKRLRGMKRDFFIFEGTSGIMSKKRWRKKWADTIALLNDAQDRADQEQKRQGEGI